ncbi:MAG: hypothetical protein ACLP1X_06800 [Polyangiaceae bacterium]|jgi:hypothetical protein
MTPRRHLSVSAFAPLPSAAAILVGLVLACRQVVDITDNPPGVILLD